MAGLSKRAAVAAIGLLLASLLAFAATPAAAAKRPNIVAIVTDDQSLESFHPIVMPRTHKLLVRRGISFEQAIVATPQCCPSRATMLTGQYSHNSGVISNRPGYELLLDKPNVLPRWLQRSGYRTAHVGKFLNGYEAARGTEVAPGWDRWATIMATHYTRPSLSVEGKRRIFEGQHLTDVINQRASKLIRKLVPKRKPLYLQIDQFAPHVGPGDEGGRCEDAAVPAPRDSERFLSAQAPRIPSYDEADVSDKPDSVQAFGRITEAQASRVDRLYGCSLASLRGVDRGVAKVIKSLKRAGELKRTMIVFTSDNGYAFGEHRFRAGKGLPYEEHLRVPMVVRPPKQLVRVRKGGVVNSDPVANVDLAPTFLDLAGAKPCLSDRCRTMDGRSLKPLLKKRDPAWARDRVIPISFDINSRNYGASCRWDGVRTPGAVLIEHLLQPVGGGNNTCEPNVQTEYYDLEADPFQLAGDGEPPALLERRLDVLRNCSGIRGRDDRDGVRSYCD